MKLKLFCYLLLFITSSGLNCKAQKEEKQSNYISQVNNNNFINSALIVDTLKKFNSIADLISYSNDLTNKLMGERSEIKKENSTSIIKIDSILWINKELIALMFYKHLMKFEKLEENFNWVAMPLYHSYTLSVEDKLRLIESYSNKLTTSEKGRTYLRYLNEQDQFVNFNISNQFNPILIDLKGSKVKFNELIKDDSKIYLLDFGASWCGPCRLFDSQLNNLFDNSLLDTSQIEVIHLSIDKNIENWQGYSSQLKLRKSYLVSEGLSADILSKFKAIGVPFYILVNRKKLVVYSGGRFEVLKKFLIDI